ncbi:hypothetical protein [Actinomadura harenae]|uniref:hypothetical protein n=1 Tax=Actinomadura harenae TaxID=2483351 RepID=UPI0011C47C9E|nr:hypothetical protein [Actinomadura harenae]
MPSKPPPRTTRRTGWIDNPDPATRGRAPSHHWKAATRHLTTHHPADGRKHRPLRLPHRVRFVRQTALAMGRGNGWGPGD